MKIQDLFYELLLGRKVTKRGWGGSYLAGEPDRLVYHSDDGRQHPWRLSYDTLLADDWELVPETPTTDDSLNSHQV